MNHDLFGHMEQALITLQPGAFILRDFAGDCASQLWQDLQQVLSAAPWRHMQTPGGLTMSVAMSNCGRLGWVSDHAGYRYAVEDPLSGQPWPPMPPSFITLAESAAAKAGFDRFRPDACLINRYEAGAKLSLHQDKDERDFSQPIVSVSLGLPATFLFGGLKRTDPVLRTELHHGDVVVWGGPARLRYHGILPLKAGQHCTAGNARINLTFRAAG
ncbi:DNA oxidative demethylase AlkB [Methylobacillus arboreus]|uniref:DNA oxidative demethylase AlkB n=1 Tax=Methylobacillus arboreus TaxID=755170 RepID=UPI001E2DFF71|nr:DNA oxidative demethylase AlkB [Methylobacillus arboreus]MCB5189939.1 DNA oxidative demethylase AlkB [Methylobacillus arboreus]